MWVTNRHAMPLSRCLRCALHSQATSLYVNLLHEKQAIGCVHCPVSGMNMVLDCSGPACWQRESVVTRLVVVV